MDMLGFVLLVIGTVLLVLFLIQLIRGGKYDQMVVQLVGDEYTLSEVYGVGMAWQETLPMLDYDGPIGQRLSKSMALLYSREYCEFYSRVAMAKSYTFLHLGACLFFLLGPVLFSDSTALLIALGGTGAAGFLAYQIISEPQGKVQAIADELTLELPNMVTKLSLLLDSGMILRDAWFFVAASMEGKMAQYMQESCEQMRNGRSELVAIQNFGNASTAKEIKRLASIMIQGLEKGNAELSHVLSQQASELWETKRQRMLQKGEESAAKLLIPTMLSFVGLILVIVVSSMGGVSF